MRLLRPEPREKKKMNMVRKGGASFVNFLWNCPWGRSPFRLNAHERIVVIIVIGSVLQVLSGSEVAVRLKIPLKLLEGAFIILGQRVGRVGVTGSRDESKAEA
jgi:hypothetical protein